MTCGYETPSHTHGGTTRKVDLKFRDVLSDETEKRTDQRYLFTTLDWRRVTDLKDEFRNLRDLILRSFPFWVRCSPLPKQSTCT